MSSPKNFSVLVYIFVILFGIASWIDINSLWVELPILVQELPEGWSLPSYIVAITQIANLGPLLYSVICAGKIKEKTVIFFIIGTCAGTCVILIFFWKDTLFVAGAQRSIPLFITNFILACVDCTSTVILFPFMATFKPAYMTAYFTGEGLGGLFPGLLGLAQGAGRVVCLNSTVYTNGTFLRTELNNTNVTLNGTLPSEAFFEVKASYGETRLSFEVFFAITCLIIVASGVSFTLLVFHPVCKKEHTKYKREDEKTKYSSKRNEDRRTSVHLKSEISESEILESEKPLTSTKMPRQRYVVSLLLTGWVNCLRNSALLAVQSYSCLPYGTTQYHLAVTLANVANPLACFFDLFVNVTSLHALSVLSVIGSLFGAYIMAAAVMSPTPVLVGTLTGSILIVTVWVVCVFLLTYVKVSLASLFRTEGKKGLLYCGVATQVGSCVGGATMFVLVNILDIFKSEDPCSG